MFSKNELKIVGYKGENAAYPNVFKKNQQLLFLQKKIERLTAALYMVTSLLSEREPMRWSLRERGIELVATALSFIKAAGNQQQGEEQKMQALFTETLMLLEVSRRAAIFSDMNVSVLKQECEALAALFADPGYGRRNNEAIVPETPLFPKDFFIIEKPDNTITGATGGDRFGEKNGTKKEPSELPEYTHSPRSFSGASEETIKDIVSKKIKDTSKMNSLKTTDKYTSRRNSVLVLLSGKSPITIKDIVKVVTDCSEKTIQRELSAMVDEGILEKSGKRRWTTYSLG